MNNRMKAALASLGGFLGLTFADIAFVEGYVKPNNLLESGILKEYWKYVRAATNGMSIGFSLFSKRILPTSIYVAMKTGLEDTCYYLFSPWRWKLGIPGVLPAIYKGPVIGLVDPPREVVLQRNLQGLAIISGIAILDSYLFNSDDEGEGDEEGEK